MVHNIIVSLCCIIIWFNTKEIKVFGKIMNINWFSNLEHISPEGEIRHVEFNPGYRDWLKEPPLGQLSPKQKIEQPKGRIIGGQDAQLGQIPYQVSIYFRKHGHWCGGSIYNKETILTAAHCFYSGGILQKKEQFVFTAGDTDLNKKEGTEMQRLASSLIIHPNYNINDYGNYDFAIVKLKKPLRYTYHVQPIPPGNPNEEGAAIISGWGYTRVRSSKNTYTHDGYSSFLQLTTIKIFTKTECSKIFSKISLKIKEVVEQSNYVCAGVLEGGRDACGGDSGGPLACVDSNGKKKLCGIVSSGIGCGLPGIPGFYMNVTNFQKWIEKYAGKADNPKRT